MLQNVPNYMEFLCNSLSHNSVIGVDPELHTIDSINEFKKMLSSRNITLKCLNSNLVDHVREIEQQMKGESKYMHENNKRPNIYYHIFNGETLGTKISKLRDHIQRQSVLSQNVTSDHNADYIHVVTELDSIFWLLNIRYFAHADGELAHPNRRYKSIDDASDIVMLDRQIPHSPLTLAYLIVTKGMINIEL
jgi:hypothetical protein